MALMSIRSIQNYFARVRGALAFQASLAVKEQARRDAAWELEDVYYGDAEKTRDLVKAELKRVSRSVNPDKAPYRLLRIMRRLVDQMAQTYKDLPVRTAGPAGSAGALAYQDVLAHSNVGSAGPKTDALARVFNTLLVRPVWVVEGEAGRLEYRIYTPAHADVDPLATDYRVPRLIQVYVAQPGPDSKPETNVYAWTAERAEKITPRGVEPMEGADSLDNPYGALPFAVLRLEDHGTFWGHGAQDLKDGQINYQAQESSLANNALAQGFSRWIGINLKLQGSTVTAGSEIASAGTVAWGADVIICRDGVSPEETQPSLEAVTPDPKLEPLANVLTNLLRTLCWTYGLSASRAVSLLSGAVGAEGQSGVAKSLDNADLEELRGKYLESFRAFERDLYRVTAKVLEVDARIVLPPAEEFSIDFVKPVVKKSTDELLKERVAKLEMGLATPVDFYVEDHPGIDPKEAEKKVIANLDLNERLQTSNVVRDALRKAEPAA